MKFILGSIVLVLSIISQLLGSDITRSFDVRTESAVSAEILDTHLEGELAGKGKHFKEVEKKYKVNATFLAAIAILESGNGKSRLARRKKNCFGLRRRDGFKTVEEGIEYTGHIISKEDGFYYGRKKYTIEHIGRTYAPIHDSPGNRRWIGSVISIMRLIQTAKEES